MENTLEKAALSQTASENYAGAAPDFLAAFGNLGAAAMANSPLDAKTNEMVILAIAIARQCEGCLLLHTRLALESGVSREELIAVINLSVLMGGGPASAYGATALKMYDDYAQAAKA